MHIYKISLLNDTHNMESHLRTQQDQEAFSDRDDEAVDNEVPNYDYEANEVLQPLKDIIQVEDSYNKATTTFLNHNSLIVTNDGIVSAHNYKNEEEHNHKEFNNEK